MISNMKNNTFLIVFLISNKSENKCIYYADYIMWEAINNIVLWIITYQNR